MNWKFVRKILSFFLAWLMVNPSGPPSGFAKDDTARRASDVKAAVLKLGAGKDARVLLILRDGEAVDGYVHQTQEDGFSVSNFCSGNVIPVPFAQVRGLRGLNMATGTRVSAGKGVRAELNATLAAKDPCGTMIIETRRWTPKHRALFETLALVGVLAAILDTDRSCCCPRRLTTS